jgi:hypothetical protein
MQSAGITLVKGDLRGILGARAISRLTFANIKQNLSPRSCTTRSACPWPRACSIPSSPGR